VKRFRGGLVFEVHRFLYHSTLGLRVIKKKKKSNACNTQRVRAVGSYVRLIDSCITQLEAQGPSMTCNEIKKGEEEEG